MLFCYDIHGTAGHIIVDAYCEDRANEAALDIASQMEFSISDGCAISREGYNNLSGFTLGVDANLHHRIDIEDYIDAARNSREGGAYAIIEANLKKDKHKC